MKIDKLKGIIVEKKPEILMGLGITGMLTSTILAVKATPKVYEIIKDEKEIRQLHEEEPLSKLDIVKLGWKYYIPAGIMFGLSSACLIGSNSEYAKRSAALAVAYGISEKALTDYRSKVVDLFGKEADAEVKDAIAMDTVKGNPVNEVFVAGGGDVLCYDTISGRYFNSGMDKLKKAENKLNYEILHNMYYSLNDFYDELGLSTTEIGDTLGWNLDDGLVELYFSGQLTDDGKPCIVVNYSSDPKYGFSKMS